MKFENPIGVSLFHIDANFPESQNTFRPSDTLKPAHFRDELYRIS